MSLAEFSKTTTVGKLAPEIVCDLSTIIHWLCPTFDYETLNEKYLESRLLDFVTALRHLSIDPVFFIRSSIGCHGDEFYLLLPSLKYQYIQKLSIHSDTARYNYDNISVNPLLLIQLQIALTEQSVKVIECTSNFIIEMYEYSCKENVCGVVSNSVEFALLPDCQFIDIGGFDLDKTFKFSDAINSQPSDIRCSFTSLNIILEELQLIDEQLIDAVMLIGNMYTQYLSSTYKFSEYLELKENTFEQFLQYVIRHDCPIFYEDGKLVHLSEVVPQFRRTIDSSYCMYFTPERFINQQSSINSVAIWIRKSSGMSSVLYAIANSGIYWREALFEAITVGRVSVHDQLVPIRELLYELLGVKEVLEFGGTSSRSFAETTVNVSVFEEEEDVLQCLLDIQDLTLRQKVSLLFKYIVYRRLVTEPKLLDSTALEDIDDDVLLKYSILCLSLYIYSNVVSQSIDELHGLVQFVLSHITNVPVPVISNKPDERSLTVSVWFSHVIQTVYYFYQVVGLGHHLPKPMELFLTFSAAKYISYNLSSFIPDYSKPGVHVSRSILSLPSVKLFCSSCHSSVTDSNCLSLIQLFSDAVNEVNTHCSNLEVDQFEATLTDELSVTDSEHNNSNVSILSVNSHKDAVLEAIQFHSVICIVGEAGCGKSTMIPQFILDSDTNSKIIVTQPRCVGASSLARRVSEQLDERCGRTVGYASGRQKCMSKDTKLIYCTSGYLLQVIIVQYM